MAALPVQPDRLPPTDPSVRDIARWLYASVRELPIVSSHGHVDPRILLEDTPFADLTSLFIQPDHYATRLPAPCLGVRQGLTGGPAGAAGGRRSVA
jgi:glucuronate isomerase